MNLETDWYAESRSLAYSVHRQYRDTTAFDDVIQTTYLCVLSLLENPPIEVYDTETQDEELRRIRSMARDHARSWCEVRKAEALGYDVDDVSWYSSKQVRDLLGYGLEGHVPDTGPPDGPRAPSDPAEGGNMQAMVADVLRSYSGLPKADRAVLLLDVHGYAVDEDRVVVARRRLHRRLGGRRPDSLEDVAASR